MQITTALEMEITKRHTSHMDGIFTFVEQPSLNDPRKKEEPGNTEFQINPSELFSLFTADIIKEKIIFTR